MDESCASRFVDEKTMETCTQNMCTSSGPVYTGYDSDNDVTGYGIDLKADTRQMQRCEGSLRAGRDEILDVQTPP